MVALMNAGQTFQRNARRAERALQTHVPHINSELDESMKVLSELAETLPIIQSQVADIRVVYDSGRNNVCSSFVFSFCCMLKDDNRRDHWSPISDGSTQNFMSGGAVSSSLQPVPFHGGGKPACDSSLHCLSSHVLVSSGSSSLVHTVPTVIDWFGEKD